MYKLKKDGTDIALVNEMRYIRMQENGAYGLCDKMEAEGVSADNHVYLFAKDIDTVEYVDGVEEINTAIADTEAAFAILSGEVE